MGRTTVAVVGGVHGITVAMVGGATVTMVGEVAIVSVGVWGGSEGGIVSMV